MSVLGSAKPAPPDESGARKKSVLGWIGVAFLTLVDSVIAMFAAGEGFEAFGFNMASFLLHFIQLAVVLGIGLAAVTWPKVGAGVMIVPGIVFTVMGRYGGQLVGVFILAAAVLLYLGCPEPKRLAYWIACGIPVGVGAATGLLAWFQVL